MLEDLHVRREEIIRDLREASGVARIRLLDMLETVDRALEDPKKLIEEGPVMTGDALVDEWERELADGRVPDLAKNLPRSRRSILQPIPSPAASRRTLDGMTGPKRSGK